MSQLNHPLEGLLKSDVDRVVERIANERLERIVRHLEKYYTGYISAAENHFAHYYHFKPEIEIRRESRKRLQDMY
jgi:23S rRNA maturation-related 3'-5' exoribonuclease YhaM